MQQKVEPSTTGMVMAGKLPRSYLEKHGASVHQQLMHEHPNLRFTYVNLRYAPASGQRPAHAMPCARCLPTATLTPT